MTRISVDSQQVLAATQSVRAASGRIRDDVASLRVRLNELDGTWTGRASTAFQGLAADWHQTQQQVEESLDRLGHALDQAARQYEQVEEQNSSLFAHHG